MTAAIHARDMAATRDAALRGPGLYDAVKRVVMARPLAWLMLIGAMLRVWAVLTPVSITPTRSINIWSPRIAC